MRDPDQIQERVIFLKGYLQSITNLIQGNYQIIGDVGVLRGDLLLKLGELKGLYWVLETKEKLEQEQSIHKFFEELRKDIEEQRKLQEQERQRLQEETKKVAELISQEVRKAMRKQ